MRLLITGGSGFIGTLVAGAAIAEGDEVIGADIAPPRRTDCQHVNLDIRDADAVRAALLRARPEVVVHLAAMHYIPECDAKPAETVATNIVGTQHVLEAARDAGAKRVFFASTAAVYRPSQEPHVEESDILPVDIYGLTKAYGEELTRRTAGPTTNVYVGRIFNVYGPGDSNPHVVPDLVEQVRSRLGREVIAVQLGNLASARDYVHVTDVARAIYMMAAGAVEPGVYNIGSGRSTPVAQLVSIVEEIAGTEIAVDSIPERQRRNDRPRLEARIERLRSLGWSPATDLRDGLRALLLED